MIALDAEKETASDPDSSTIEPMAPDAASVTTADPAIAIPVSMAADDEIEIGRDPDSGTPVLTLPLKPKAVFVEPASDIPVAMSLDVERLIAD